MRKSLLFAVALVFGVGAMASAQVFAWPTDWSVAKPGQAVYGGQLVDSTISDFRTMNPFISAETISIDQIESDNVGLTKYNPVTGKIIPWMATGWTISNGGKTFVFDIRKGMKFSDGTPITSEDWITTWKIHTDKAVGSNGYDSFFISGKPIILKALGPYKLEADFPVISASALETMGFTPWPAHIFGPIYKKEGAAGIKNMWTLSTPPSQIVSPGPFIISGYRPGERAVFTRNKYFGEWNHDSQGNPLPYLNGVTYEILKDVNSQLASYLAGKIDVFIATTVAQVSQIKQASASGNLKANIVANASPVASSQFIVFNWNKAKDSFLQWAFRNVQFRRAMSELSDREGMVQLVFGGLGTPTYGSVYPVYKQWADPNTPKYSYDPQAAAKLLAEIGFTKRDSNGWLIYAGPNKAWQGKRLEFTLTTNSGNNQREQMAQIFQKSAKEIGVKVNFAPIDFNTLVGQLLATGDNRPFDAILIGLGSGSLAWPFGVNVLPCGTNLHMYNTSGTCLTPQETLMTALFYQGQETLSFEKRVKIGYQIQQVQAELQPIIYLVGPAWSPSWLDKVGGNHPKDALTSVWGQREIELTYIKK